MAVSDKKKETTAQGGYPKQVCKYDPVRDAEEVISGLNCDINDMLQTGVVRDTGRGNPRGERISLILTPSSVVWKILSMPWMLLESSRSMVGSLLPRRPLKLARSLLKVHLMNRSVSCVAVQTQKAVKCSFLSAMT